MRYIDLQWAFPNFIIAVYLVAVFGTGLSNVIVAVSLAFVNDFARIARGMVLTIKEEQYVAAARAGCSDWRIMWRHICRTRAPLIVQATVSVSYAILAEAGALVPRPRRRGLDPDLGPDPRRLPQLHLARLVARRVPRPVHRDHGAVDQLPRRRTSRDLLRRARDEGPGARVESSAPDLLRQKGSKRFVPPNSPAGRGLEQEKATRGCRAIASSGSACAILGSVRARSDEQAMPAGKRRDRVLIEESATCLRTAKVHGGRGFRVRLPASSAKRSASWPRL